MKRVFVSVNLNHLDTFIHTRYGQIFLEFGQTAMSFLCNCERTFCPKSELKYYDANIIINDLSNTGLGSFLLF